MKQPYSRRTVITFGATCLVVAVTATGTSLVSGQSPQRPQSHKQLTSTPTTPDTQTDTLAATSQPVDNHTATSPAMTNTAQTSTTVSINDDTTIVNGQEVPNDYQKSYISEDGSTHVDISVHNSATSTKTSVQSTSHTSSGTKEDSTN